MLLKNGELSDMHHACETEDARMQKADGDWMQRRRAEYSFVLILKLTSFSNR